MLFADKSSFDSSYFLSISLNYLTYCAWSLWLLWKLLFSKALQTQHNNPFSFTFCNISFLQSLLINNSFYDPNYDFTFCPLHREGRVGLFFTWLYTACFIFVFPQFYISFFYFHLIGSLCCCAQFTSLYCLYI